MKYNYWTQFTEVYLIQTLSMDDENQYSFCDGQEKKTIENHGR